MAILTGYTIPVQLPVLWGLPWDHVYVASDDPIIWGCFGRTSGGIEICSGIADSAAECLSHDRGQLFGLPVYADLLYAAEGVCHQAANRILHSIGNGGTFVDLANGYGLSLTLYGTYGLGSNAASWPRLNHCASVHANPGVVGTTPTGDPVRQTQSKATQLANDLRQIYEQADSQTDEVSIHRQEFEALARARLGGDYDQNKIAAVAELQSYWRIEHGRFTERLKRGDLSPDGYIAVLRQTISDVSARCEKILGPNDFQVLFGVPAGNAADLLTPLSR